MAESTLSLKITDLQGEVGLFLGYGRGADNGDTAWNSEQSALIASFVKSGLRQFYFPPPLAAGEPSYDWSFLHPTATVTLAGDSTEVDLPDDFGGLDSPVIATSSTSAVFGPLEPTGEGPVRERLALLPNATGVPSSVAVIPAKGVGPVSGQRFKLLVYPKADADYTLRFNYTIIPDALTGARPYAYGGAQHVETVLASCLAIAEERGDDDHGVMRRKFMERLAASISRDRQMLPGRLGYNGDRGRLRGLTRHDAHLYGDVLYEGVSYE